MELSSSEKKALRGRAQLLLPCVLIGKSGVSEGVISTIDQALSKEGLVKVRFTRADSSPEENCAFIVEQAGAQLINTLGKTAVFYRRCRKNSRS